MPDRTGHASRKRELAHKIPDKRAVLASLDGGGQFPERLTVAECLDRLLLLAPVADR
jgi:hypothetical protein